VRNASRTDRLASGTENATTLQRPSQGSPSSAPKPKIRAAPSLSTSCARGVSPWKVFRPDRVVASRPCLTIRLSAARAATSLTPKSASSSTRAADGSGSVCPHQ
jgi:hypothetical protein